MNVVKDWKVDSSWTLFLDRDGTINKRVTGYITDWSQFQFIEHSLEALSRFSTIFAKIIIVTNQQGVGKELMTEKDLQNIHDNMLDTIQYFDGRIDAIYFEPSLSAYNALRRKPNPGMAMDAKQDFPEIDFKKSIMIGDTQSDMEFGHNLGMKTVWIENTMEQKNKQEILKYTTIKTSSLLDFYNTLI